MPSGKTHDTITFLLAVPALAATFAITRNYFAAMLVGLAFVFGGVMFGPDLDTVSRQYSRWMFLRFLWLPYRWCFKHRSRFSHGLICGALFRVIYFIGISTLLTYFVALLASIYGGTQTYDLQYFVDVWRNIGEVLRRYLGDGFMLHIFVGLWFGAASHTLTDVAGSFIKTGRVAKFL